MLQLVFYVCNLLNCFLPKQAPDSKQINEDIKGQMRNIFIDELIRRYRLSATFEMATGTVVPMHTYPESDPVVAFYRKDRDEDLAGQKWNAEADCEYLRKAMKGLGKALNCLLKMYVTK